MIDLTVGRALRLAAEARPGAVALTFEGTDTTYGELEAESNRIARALTDLGLVKGDRIGVMMPNSAFYFAVICGAAKAGVVLVFLNYRFTATEIVYHLGDAGAKALLYDTTLAGPAHEASRQLSGLRLLAAGERNVEDALWLADVAATQSREPPSTDVRETDMLVLQYTSGTTGRPKGAMITHRNRSLAFLHWPTIFGYGPEDVILHAGPLHHSAPMGMTLSQLCLGGRAVVMRSFNATEALRLIEQQQVTWAFLVPYMYSAICGWLEQQSVQPRLASLRVLLSGASPLPTPVKERILSTFPNAGLFEFYGATEAGTITTLRPRDQKRKTRSVGKPVLGAEVRILDINGQPVPQGEVGEIYLRTPSMFEGYYGAPEKTEAAFHDGWCTLGDLGRQDEEGYLYIVDRVKDVIKSGGVNIYPSEIEEAVLTHPDVMEAAVIGLPHERWGEAVHLIAIPWPGRKPAVGELIAHCRRYLADYKVPKSGELRGELPRSAAGKVLKRTLRNEYWGGSVKV